MRVLHEPRGGGSLRAAAVGAATGAATGAACHGAATGCGAGAGDDATGVTEGAGVGVDGDDTVGLVLCGSALARGAEGTGEPSAFG